MELRIRPRWRRIFRAPRLVRLYRRNGFSWRFSIRMAYEAVMAKAKWV